MPVEISWILAEPAALAILSPPSTLPPLLGIPDGCPVVGLTQAELLEVVAKSYPADYIDGLRNTPNGGYEQFEAAAKLMARVSEAVAELYCCCLVRFAHGGVKAIGFVEIYRENDDNGDVTVPAGSVVMASRTGRRFLTLADAAFTGGALGPFTVAVEAVEVGQEYNMPGQIVTGGGELLEGEIDTLLILGVTSTFDPNIRVRQVANTTSGRSACLDGLGEDVLIPRQTFESDDAYRLRILNTPDTVSPNAIQRGLDQLLSPLHACVREVGTERLPGMFYDAGSSEDSPQVPANNYAYDLDFTVRPEDRFKLALDFTEMRGFMMIGVPPVIDLAFGIAYDGGAGDAVPLANPADGSTTDTFPVANPYDGSTIFSGSLYKAIYAMVDDKRAGGVGFVLYLETIGCF